MMSGDDIEPGSADEQRRYEEKNLAPPQVWRLTKTGEFYSIMCVSRHAQTGEELVTYRPSTLDSERTLNKYFTLSRAMFLDFGGPDGAARFTRIR